MIFPPQFGLSYILPLIELFYSGLVTNDSPAVKARVVCYWGSWNIGQENYIPVDKCTHVIYSFIGLNNGTWKATVLNPQVPENNYNYATMHLFIPLSDQ